MTIAMLMQYRDRSRTSDRPLKVLSSSSIGFIACYCSCDHRESRSFLWIHLEYYQTCKAPCCVRMFVRRPTAILCLSGDWPCARTRLPVTALKLCVFNRWAAGFGQFNEEVRLIAPDQSTLMRKSS